MPHQNVDSPKAVEQNAAAGSGQPNDMAREQSESVRTEPRSYVAANAADASLALPAAGEVADYMDEGDALGDDGVQQGSTHANRPIRTEADRGQGPKTRAANRRIVKTGQAERR